MKLNQNISNLLAVFVFFLFSVNSLRAQTEVMAWGNLTGIRIDGQLMEFETSIRVVAKDWSSTTATGKEKQQPKYHREGQTQLVKTELGGIQVEEYVKEAEKGAADISITAISKSDTTIEGVFFCIEIPESYYANATVILNGRKQKLSQWLTSKKVTATNLKLVSEKRQLEITMNAASPLIIRKENSTSGCQVYIGLMGTTLTKDQQARKTIKIKATGVIDNAPAEITLDSKNPGRLFAGFGGNFRLQNPKADPQVIQYCLDNMRVAWGRVEMPWNLWQPDENINPMELAISGKLNDHVRNSMEMALKLAKMDIPMVISDWQAPAWAIVGDPSDAYKFRYKGIYGYPLKPDKRDKIYKSISNYLVYLKQNYGVEPALFSFNESDLGINIRHTGKEHADFIKGLGAYLASQGITTKLLLGDNSDATTFDFILPALNDPETHKYIGAVSFHSWRGCDDATLKKWADAAKHLNLPLIIAEGSTDAAAWSYPEIFYEQAFALYEINLYMRLCSICEPLSILQWQLTSDYSPLKGEGIYGTGGPLTPTRRFWNLKQLASTPANAFSIPVSCNKEEINCAAFGNIAKGDYAVHLVNNGAVRQITIKGIPAGIEAFDIFVTDESKGMEKTGTVKVENGVAVFQLLPASFTTLKN